MTGPNPNFNCSYPKCTCQIPSADPEKCIFHAESDKKGDVTDEEFKELILEKINNKDYNFEGYVFHIGISFEQNPDPAGETFTFEDDVNFSKAEFQGSITIKMDWGEQEICVDFRRAEFKKTADFREAQFTKKADFIKAQFSGYAYFSEAQFSVDTDFSKAKFSRNAYFIKAQFSGYADFIEAQFSGYAYFSEAQFSVDTDFREAQFSRNAYFIKAQFSGYADFREARFSGDAYFIKAQFSGKADFREAQFTKKADFIKAQFSGIADFDESQFFGHSSFRETEFRGHGNYHLVVFHKDVLFSGCAKFLKGANFSKSQFCAKSKFTGAKFSEEVYFFNSKFVGPAEFAGSEFSGNVYFNNAQFSQGAYFARVRFLGQSSFHFRNITTPNRPDGRGYSIFFHQVLFNPFAAYFESIKPKDEDKSEDINQRSTIIVRYCKLKDVYLINNDLSLFSFYKSSFDQARFINNSFNQNRDKALFIEYNRKNLIFEDEIHDKLDDENRKEFGLEDLTNRQEIASLYRRMKTALDSTKDYEQSGWFYFNELEMKRLALIDEHEEQGRIKFNMKRILSKRFIYYWYKVLAGYGEKPLWSLVWFWIFAFIFTGVNLLSGLRVGEGDGCEIVNYKFSASLSGVATLFTGEFWGDVGHSILFTLYRVIPVNYLPFERAKLAPIGLDGLAWSFLNSIVLILMAVFIAIGLKRHFRRF